jgi:hypothetical protein
MKGGCIIPGTVRQNKRLTLILPAKEEAGEGEAKG